MKAESLLAVTAAGLVAAALAAPLQAQQDKGELDRTVQFEAVDVLNPGDWVVVWIDMQTFQPRELYFKASLDDEAVQAGIVFRLLDDGVFYAAETRWDMPTKELKGTIENTEHQRP